MKDTLARRTLALGLAAALTFGIGAAAAQVDPRLGLLVASGNLPGQSMRVALEDTGAAGLGQTALFDDPVSDVEARDEVSLDDGPLADDLSAALPSDEMPRGDGSLDDNSGPSADSNASPNRGQGSVDSGSPATSDDMTGGMKLRGDGTVDDNLPSHSGLDDMVGGVDLRGDGTVDDNLPSHSGLDDMVNGVKLRGDGTVDDDSADSGRNRGSDDRDDDRSGRGRGRR